MVVHKSIHIAAFLLIVLLFPPPKCRSMQTPSRGVVLQKADQEKASDLLEKIDLLNGQGKYAEAIPFARELLHLVEKEKGSSHQGVAACLSVLGGLYCSFGDYDKAKPILKRSLEINERLEGRESPNVATSLGLLAKVYGELGEYQAALPFAERALRIRENTVGGGHFSVSTSLNTLGEIYSHLRQFDKAEPLFLRALEIRKAHENAHSLLITLNNLCDLYYQIHEYDAAESLAGAALELGQDTLGNDHIHVAEIQSVLGKISAAKANFTQAFKYFKEVQRIHLQAIDEMKGFTSEKQKLKFLRKIRKDLDIFLSLIFENLRDYPEAEKEGLNIVLKRKGIVLEVQRQFQQALLSDDDSALKIFQKLSEIRALRSNLVFSGPGPGESAKTHRERMGQLKSEKERLDTQLSTLSASYTLYLKKSEASCKNVASVLPAHSALIEFIQIKVFDFRDRTDRRWGGPRYYAFILLAGSPDRVHVVSLGDSQEIEENILNFKRKIQKRDVQQLDKTLIFSDALYSQIFLPLEKHLGDTSHVFLSPDGTLSLIPFEIFRQQNGYFLVSKYTFNYLACGRDMLGFGERALQGKPSIIMGNPDFDLINAEEGTSISKNSEKESPFLAASYSRDLRGLHFSPLPGTQVEVQEISNILGRGKIELYTGKMATEEVLMQADSPRFLHLATHGFFLPDQDIHGMSENGLSRGLQIHKKVSSEYYRVENPLLRSGLALAGANRFRGRKPGKSGIITAEKILSLNLRGTKMVVLSACETGVGEVRVGEGVFGLRRAFLQAGAMGLVMSMWPVPDRETSELMAQFYENIISKKMNRAEALRQAMLGHMGVVEKRYGAAHPLYWGAFVFLGEPD